MACGACGCPGDADPHNGTSSGGVYDSGEWYPTPPFGCNIQPVV